MEIKVKIYNKLVLFDKNSVILEPNKILKIVFEKLDKRLQYYLKTEKGNFEIIDNKIEIPVESGIIKTELFATLQGKEVKRWICEDLIINELNNGIEAIPEIEQLKAENELLKIDINTLNEKYENVLKYLKEDLGE